MRTRRLVATLTGGLALAALALAPSAGAAALTSVTKVACPATTPAPGCTAKVVASTLVHPATGSARLATVGTASATIAPGATSAVVVPLNAVGGRELRVRGRFEALLRFDVDGSRFNRRQVVTIPTLVVDEETTLKRVALAPGQRLLLRLDGENPSTGHAWKTDPLAANAALRLVSTRAVVRDDCEAGVVGCFQLRELTYVGRRAGTTAVSTGLYGPQAQTDAVVRIDLQVATRAAVPKPVVVIDDATPAKAVTLARGQELVVRLVGASASAGYAWSAPRLPAAAPLLLVGTATVEDDCLTGTAGCGAVTEFTYVSRVAGTTNVVMALRAPDGSITRTFRLPVTSR